MKSQLRSFVIDNFLYGEGAIDDDQDLFEAGILDSLGFMKLLGYVEKTFGVSMDMSEVTTDNFATLNRMVETIEEKKAG